jgi:hypothetical protein
LQTVFLVDKLLVPLSLRLTKHGDGNTVEAKNIREGATIGEIPAPEKSGYVFGDYPVF